MLSGCDADPRHADNQIGGDPCRGRPRCSARAPEPNGSATLPLGAGQRMAIGTVARCHGTLIGPQWVLSAAHCDIRPGDRFCTDIDSRVVCAEVERVEQHHTSDVALLRLNAAFSGARPIAVVSSGAEAVLAQATIETVGDVHGNRQYARGRATEIAPATFTVDAEEGRCFGDSGGPALVIGADGKPAVAGVLSGGDPRCAGSDVFARIDVVSSWLDATVGRAGGAHPLLCGELDAQGRCIDGFALWCEDGVWSAAGCDSPTVCRYNEPSGGFRCAADSGSDCGSLDVFGTCDGEVAHWCDRGARFEHDCSMLGATCEYSRAEGGAYCRDLTCGGLGWRGRCDGTVAEWCELGERTREPCGDPGCGLTNELDGYFCR